MQRFVHEITVGPASIDVLGHASNIEYLRWVQDVAVAHSRHLGLDTADYQAMRGAWVVRRHEVDYVRQALEGDVLTVATWIASHTRVQCARHTEITNARGEVVARAVTHWVFVSMDTMRPARIPEAVRAAFGMA